MEIMNALYHQKFEEALSIVKQHKPDLPIRQQSIEASFCARAEMKNMGYAYSPFFGGWVNEKEAAQNYDTFWKNFDIATDCNASEKSKAMARESIFSIFK